MVLGAIAFVSLDKGLEAVVDAADADLVRGYRWTSTVHKACGNTYAVRFEGDKVISMHRHLMGSRKDRQIDHRDRDGLNNRRANMRLATPSQNQANRPAQKNNVLGVKGVNRKRNRFQANIAVNGKKKYLGLFPTIEEAASAYRAAAVELYGEFAFLT